MWEKILYSIEMRKNLMLNRGETDENEVVVLWRLPINFGCQLFPPTPPINQINFKKIPFYIPFSQFLFNSIFEYAISIVFWLACDLCVSFQFQFYLCQLLNLLLSISRLNPLSKFGWKSLSFLPFCGSGGNLCAFLKDSDFWSRN